MLLSSRCPSASFLARSHGPKHSCSSLHSLPEVFLFKCHFLHEAFLQQPPPPPPCSSCISRCSDLLELNGVTHTHPPQPQQALNFRKKRPPFFSLTHERGPRANCLKNKRTFTFAGDLVPALAERGRMILFSSFQKVISRT